VLEGWIALLVLQLIVYSCIAGPYLKRQQQIIQDYEDAGANIEHVLGPEYAELEKDVDELFNNS